MRLSFLDDPASSLISGGASIIAAGMTSSASKYAADRYLKGVQETNETNLRLAHEQQDWDLAQWNRENEYNSAKSQLQRWQDAGFSPHSFIEVGDPGNAASLQSPDLANQIPPPDTSGFQAISAQSIMQGVQGAVNAGLAWREIKLKQDALNIDKERLANETKDIYSSIDYRSAMTKDALKHVDWLESQMKLTEQQRYKAHAEYKLAMQQWQQNKRMFELEYRFKSRSFDSLHLDTILKEKTMQTMIAQASANLQKSKAETELLAKQAVYWAWQGKEGEFNYDTQGLRWEILSTQSKQAMFNLQFDKDFRVSQMYFDRWMQSIHALTELGQLGAALSKEAFRWASPGSYVFGVR